MCKVVVLLDLVHFAGCRQVTRMTAILALT